MLNGWYRHRHLVAELIKREFSGRYRGSFGGVLWSFVQPLFMMVVYTLAFGVGMQVRWSASGSTTEYALMLLAGLIVFNALSEILNRAPSLMTGNPNFVKKVVFPLELLPVVTVATALIHAVVGVSVWLAGHLVLIGMPPPTAPLFLLVLACFAPLLLGLGWLLAAVGTFVRDVQQLTGVLGMAILFLSPVFYSLQAAPAAFRSLLQWNPMTLIVEQLRAVLFQGQPPAACPLAMYLLVSSVFAWLAFKLFKRMRPTFADFV